MNVEIFIQILLIPNNNYTYPFGIVRKAHVTTQAVLFSISQPSDQMNVEIFLTNYTGT